MFDKNKVDTLNDSFKNRFWAKGVLNGDCLEWNGHCNSKGYGVTAIKGEFIFAHRLAYLLSVGEIPDGMLVCHKCDNPCCINPSHLFIGTPKDNVDDMMKKGRGNILRVKKRSAKLTWRQVCEIRIAVASGVPEPEVADWYNISQPSVSRIRSRELWPTYRESVRKNNKVSRNPKTRTPLLTRMIYGIMLRQDGCWEWTKKSRNNGLPYIGIGDHRHTVLVYREFYRVLIGEIGSDDFLVKSCGTESCVNPWHYELCTRGDLAARFARPARWAESEG